MQTFTKTKINLKEQVAKVIAAKPAMLAAIAKQNKAIDGKDTQIDSSSVPAD